MAKIMKFTKIVATLGPNSRNPDTVERLLREGADVIRLNFSHGNHEDHALSVRLVKEAAEKLNRYIAIFQDLQGPKIRLGQLEGESLDVAAGEILVLTTDDLMGGVHDGVKKVSIDHRGLHEEVKPGDRVLIDDGLFEFVVERIEGHEIFTQVVNGGRLKPRKGVNLPNVKLRISAITDKDRADFQFAYDHWLDYVALSFVRDADDVKELIDVMLTTYGRKIPIIAKIEKPEAFRHIEGIIAVADAIMVARGDLGVETSPQDVPLMQKTIIRQCNIAGKPVITATQMLESMINNPRPTRAEANDVANAILDGTDAVMLSAETAAGKYPVETVESMARICIEAERSAEVTLDREFLDRVFTRIDQSIAMAAIWTAHHLKVKAIAALTQSGSTALWMSRLNCGVPIYALTPDAESLARMVLYREVYPLLMKQQHTDRDLALQAAEDALKERAAAADGDLIVLTIGEPIGSAGGTNTLKIVRVGEHHRPGTLDDPV